MLRHVTFSGKFGCIVCLFFLACIACSYFIFLDALASLEPTQVGGWVCGSDVVLNSGQYEPSSKYDQPGYPCNPCHSQMEFQGFWNVAGL